MATVTLNTMAMQLVTEMGHSISENWLITQAERFINDAVRHLLNYAEWPFRETTDTTINTVAGTASYSLTTNACEIRGLRLGGSYDKSLRQVDLPWLSSQDFDLELQGEPQYWYPAGYNTSTQKVGFGLWPIPSAIYSIIPYITLMAVDLTSDSTIPLPESCYSALRDGARYYMEQHQGRTQDAAQALRMFDASLRILRHKYTVYEAEEMPREYTDVKGMRGRRRFPGFSGRYPL
jgi:hypothetical protein